MWTSVGVIVGVFLVALTGWERLDPVVAALVGVNILITGYRLVSQSVTSLLDAALPEEDLARLTAVLDRLRTPDVDFADLRTRESGRHRFVSLTLLVPGDWTVERAHDVADEVEAAIAADLTGTDVRDPHRAAGTPPHGHGRRPPGPGAAGRPAVPVSSCRSRSVVGPGPPLFDLHGDDRDRRDGPRRTAGTWPPARRSPGAPAATRSAGPPRHRPRAPTTGLDQSSSYTSTSTLARPVASTSANRRSLRVVLGLASIAV